MILETGLYLVGTPIGNMGDITQRAIDILRDVDVLACEDTRVAKKLLSLINVEKPAHSLIAIHDHNEFDKASEVVQQISNGLSVAYVSDAGMPGISDPGAHLVNAARNAGVSVVCVPGPSAVVMAMSLSGFAQTAFSFVGFAPRSGKDRSEFLNAVSLSGIVTIAYESPHRLHALLKDLETVVGDRRVVVCRELTKKFEEVFRGTASECAAHFSGDVKGECVVVIESALETPSDLTNDEAVISAIETLIAAGVSSKDVADVVTRMTPYPKNDVKRLYEQLRGS